ncbi:MAG: hypothetical protein ACI914_001445 [Candidatus Marivariicella framensis]|jgi:hypothetical protein
MPIPLFHSIASWALKKRITQIELFVKYPNETQQEVLLKLLNTAKNTEIGKKYKFNSIENYEDFKNRLPIVKYEEISKSIERCRQGEQNIFWPSPIKWFAKSSGTTNSKSKFIPVSTESLEDCHYKAGKDMLSLYLNNNKDSQLMVGKCLRLGGSGELYENNNSYFGDLSAIFIDNLPFWAELGSTPSNKVSLMTEWESKMEAIISETLNEKVTSLAGMPSWMFVLLQNALKRKKVKKISDIWPNIEVYFHGGVNFKPYKNQFENLFNDKQLKFYEIYNASEGFFAIQDQNNSSELLLMLDYGIFYEFLSMDSFNDLKQNIIPLWEVKVGINYALVITTNAGLWRYLIGDTIKFTTLKPYRIKITGRTKHFINVFGEELIIENAEEAISLSAKEFSVSIINYTVGPVFMKKNSKGGHEWLIEFDKPPKNIEYFSIFLDKKLKELNSDYEAKRYKSMTLKKPLITIAKKNLFYEWLSSINKLGGQNKIPRLSNSRKYIDSLLKTNI